MPCDRRGGAEIDPRRPTSFGQLQPRERRSVQQLPLRARHSGVETRPDGIPTTLTIDQQAAQKKDDPQRVLYTENHAGHWRVNALVARMV